MINGEAIRDMLVRLFGPIKLSETPPPAEQFRYNKTPKAYVPPSDPASARIAVESRYMEKTANANTRDVFSVVTHQALNPKLKPFETAVPHRQIITDLAHLGEITKGEYHRTAAAVEHLFGHDAHGPTAWMLMNGILSPQTRYSDHAGAASLLTAKFLALSPRQRKDEREIDRIIYETNESGRGLRDSSGRETTGNSFGFALSTEVKRETAKHALLNIEHLKDSLENPKRYDPLHYVNSEGKPTTMLNSPRALKVVNFINAYFQQHLGAPIDTHMLRLLMNPDLSSHALSSDFMRQFKDSDIDDPKELEFLQRQGSKGLPVSSEVVKLLMRNNTVSIPSGLTKKGEREFIGPSEWMKRMNTALITRPPVYLAYKHALHESAVDMGWNLAQVQESVWTGIISLLAVNSVVADGHPIDDVIQALDNDAIKKGWQNHESFYFPELVKSYAARRDPQDLKRKLEQSQAEHAEASSRPLNLHGRTRARLRDIAAHLPSGAVADASSPIRRALRESLDRRGLISTPFAQEGEPVRMMIQPDELARLRQYTANEASRPYIPDPASQTARTVKAPAPKKLFSGWVSPVGEEHPFQDGEDNHSIAASRMTGIADSDAAFNSLYDHGWIRISAANRLGAQEPHNITTGSFRSLNTRISAQKFIAKHYHPDEKVFIHGTDSTYGRHMKAEHAHKALGVFDSRIKEDPFGAIFRPAQLSMLQAIRERIRRQREPLRLAQYDRPLDFIPAMQRAMSSNYKTFATQLRAVLQRSGVTPHEVTPAVHDVTGQARATVFAAGTYKNPNAPALSSAWAGLLGRQPGMVSFLSHPQGVDSIYRFSHGDSDVVREALSNAGVGSRVLVPSGSNYHVYVFDRGRSQREAVSRTLIALGVQADEWRGNGHAIGGKVEDMGRGQYRDVISQQAAPA